MWIYYYISEKRVAQLAYQINPELPSEIVKNWGAQGSTKGVVEAKTSKLIEALGISGKASADINAGASSNLQRKIDVPNESIIDTVCEYLVETNHFSLISDQSINSVNVELKKLLRFRGAFKPKIEGDNYADKSANLWESKFLGWEGSCGEINISFTTSLNSFESDTPIYECLQSDENTLFLDGFGTLNKRIDEKNISLLPLFFGIDLE